jgi:exo-1,4-beta-D-glucosaminidase
LPKAQIVTNHQIRDLGDEQEIQVTLQNTSQSIAFFIELNVYGSESGLSVLPIYWEDNYVSLLPGETREILGRFSKDDLRGETPAFRYSGWNVRSE